MGKLLKSATDSFLRIGEVGMRLKLWCYLPSITGIVIVSAPLLLSPGPSSQLISYIGKVQKESLTAETEPGNVPSERVLSKAGFQRGDFVQGAFEVTDLITGKLVKKDATTWRIDRPSA